MYWLKSRIKTAAAALAEPNNLWDKIGALAPEYIAMRRSASLDWPGIQSLVAT